MGFISFWGDTNSKQISFKNTCICIHTYTHTYVLYMSAYTYVYMHACILFQMVVRASEKTEAEKGNGSARERAGLTLNPVVRLTVMFKQNPEEVRQPAM